MISRSKSDTLFAEALKYIPGGVNSPVRAFRAVGGKPFFVNKASSCRVWDVDGNEYIDYVGTWGPAILGHAHPKIIAAIKAAADHGTSFGMMFRTNMPENTAMIAQLRRAVVCRLHRAGRHARRNREARSRR